MKKRSGCIKLLFGVLSFALIVVLSDRVKAFAASVAVSEINYENSTITVTGNADDTMIYFSDSKKKTWDEFAGTMTVDKKMTMDISWISLTKDYTITFKGNASEDVVTVKLPKQVTTFKAKYSSGAVTFTGASGRSIQWRKDGSSVWKDYPADSDALYPLSLKGCTVYFRLKPVNGDSSSAGMRPSKEVSVKVGAVTAAPTMTFNGTKLAFTVKTSMKYKVKAAGTDSWPAEWTKCDKNGDLLLYTIAPSVFAGTGSQPDYVEIQFMSDATSTSQRSAVKTVKIPKQDLAPDMTSCGISLEKESFEAFSITVKAASATAPFEYAVCKSGASWDPNAASWIKISGGSKITIKSTSAPAGSDVYVRRATKSKPGDDGFAIASAPLKLTGEGGLSYLDKTDVGEKIERTTVAGNCREDNQSGWISFDIKSKAKTTVSKLEFADWYSGASLGEAKVSSSVSDTAADGYYNISCTIKSTENLESRTGEWILAKITLATGEEILSTNGDGGKGLRLYIYPASKINTTASGDYTSSFERIFESNNSSDKESFSFRIDFGAAKLNNGSTDTSVSELTYSGYALSSGTDYNVVYGTDTVGGSNVRTAEVTVNVKNFERSASVTVRDKIEPLKISLNNGETVNGVNITLISTAAIANAPISKSFTKGNLAKVNAGTSEKPVWTDPYVFELVIFSNSYSVSVQRVTWNGNNVLGKSDVGGGKAEITLDTEKLNQINETGTNDLAIKLSNGFEITSGYKITITE